MHTWDDDQQWESDWWGNCCNTFAEETKQITYAHRMGLVNEPRDGMWPVYDLRGKSIVDIGGGPTSMLLRSVNGTLLDVFDPCDYPSWVNHRYSAAGIGFHKIAGEDIVTGDGVTYDEAWIYNVLQHVQDPRKIVENAKAIAKTVRIFEWIDLPPHVGHPQELKAHLLQQWLTEGPNSKSGVGVIEQMNENGCNARAFYGFFLSP